MSALWGELAVDADYQAAIASMTYEKPHHYRRKHDRTQYDRQTLPHPRH
jgi:hypothetical protein